MQTPLVSAIVLTYKTPTLAVRCVQALKAQTIADQLEIIVVDNHSEDDSIGILRNRLKDLENVHIVEAKDNIGYGKGNNLGSRFAKGKYLLITNPDNELLPDCLERMVGVMERDSSLGIVAPRLVFDDGSTRDSHRGFPTLLDVLIKRTPLRRLFAARMERYLQSKETATGGRDVAWVVGACLLMQREFFLALHGFDPRFFLFFEDIDLCRRIWLAGKRVHFLPEAVARDRKQRLSEGGVIMMLRKRTGRAHVKSAFQYFWKWHGQPLPR